MAIQIEFKPITDAIVRNIKAKDPEEVLFVVGRKKYTAKIVLQHFKKEDDIATEIIKMAIKVNVNNKQTTLSLKDITPEVIEKTAKMFEV